MELKERDRLEKKHKIVISQHPGDHDLFTVVYVLDIPANDVQHACIKAMKIINNQIRYDTEPATEGPVFEVISPNGKRYTVDYNEVDSNGQDGSITER